MDLVLYVHEWTTGKFDLLKYQQYMLTMCECWGGGECHIMCLVSPLDVASYSKLLIPRQWLIQRQGRPKVYHRQACWEQLKTFDFGFLFLILFSQIVHVHTHTCIHTYIHTHTHTHTHTHIYTCTHAYMHTHICIHAHTYMRARARTHTHTHRPGLYHLQ